MDYSDPYPADSEQFMLIEELYKQTDKQQIRIDGKIGKEALALWRKYGHERPDYKTYVKRMTHRQKTDKLEEIAITKEFEAMEADKIKEETKTKPR